jgi:hypothetical protein
LRITVLLTLCACVLSIACKQSTSAPAATTTVRVATGPSAGARIDKPFSLEITGAECYSGRGKNAGDVAFGFPNRAAETSLQFTIGPLRDGFSPGQENNKPYAGPGDYTNVGIVVKTAGKKPVVGYGVITVNADEQSGTFRLPGDSPSGTWNCGHKLER